MSDPCTNLVLFDGICNLCNRIIQFIIKRDPEKKFKFASLQSEIGQQWLERFSLTNAGVDSIVLIQDGKCYIKSTAVLHVLKELGGVRRVFYILAIIPAPVRDFMYDVIARSRYRVFGKRPVCMVPTADLKERFL